LLWKDGSVLQSSYVDAARLVGEQMELRSSSLPGRIGDGRIPVEAERGINRFGSRIANEKLWPKRGSGRERQSGVGVREVKLFIHKLCIAHQTPRARPSSLCF
jgi:hypothetical protein